ncbi:MAG: AMP-binding protein [Clostridia bacterium]|nr:AMP-binding protein [Clostridia bacterium]
MEETMKQRHARKWAESIIEIVKNDKRPVVRFKDNRPVTDLKDMLNSSAALYGDNIAFLQKWDPQGTYESVTYKEVLSDVNGFGTEMMAMGLKDKRVSVIGQNCYQWATAYLTVTGGIGCIVPLDRELSRDELKSQVARAEVTAVVCGSKHREIFESIIADGDTALKYIIDWDFDESEPSDHVFSWEKMIARGKKLIDEGDRSYIDAEVDNEVMSILLFTSGTTGVPKGVMISQKNLCSQLMIGPTVYHVDPEDRFFSFLPMHHTYEATCGFLVPLYKGASIAFCQGMKYVTKNMVETSPTNLMAVPALYEKMYATIWRQVRKKGLEKKLLTAIKFNRASKKVGVDMSGKLFADIHAIFGGKMKTMICGGAKIDPAILDGLKDFGFNAIQGYGLTEAAPLAAMNPEIKSYSDSVGVPFPGQEIKTVDADSEGIGELCIKGPNIMLGYFNDPEETAKVIDEDGFFHTGDLGYIDKNGYAYITGRAKNVIITKNGKNVYPEVIEQYLGQVDFIEESFVFEDKNAAGSDTCIVASIKVDDEIVKEKLKGDYTDDDVKELIKTEVARINSEAPSYRRIARVILRKADFVHNTSSKLIRSSDENRAEN